MLACVGDDRCAAIRTFDDTVDDDELIPAVERLLADASWKYEDLTHVACVSGPGGFTSLRMAAAYANAVSGHLGIPSASVHLSDVYRHRFEDKDAVWIHSTKKHEVFIKGWGIHANAWPEPTHMRLDEAVVAKGVVRTGELIDEHERYFDDLSTKKAVMVSVEEVLPRLLGAAVYDGDPVMPWYGRAG